FSSRRRHTRFSRDWSSDVCSSDLPESEPDWRLPREIKLPGQITTTREAQTFRPKVAEASAFEVHQGPPPLEPISEAEVRAAFQRSEERRVGKEGGWWGAVECERVR